MAQPAQPLPSSSPSLLGGPPVEPGAPRFRLLPPVGTWKYHLLLSAVAIFILGPLGGVAASYMNFSMGFFVGGQVLAGILGSAVTYGYGPDGKHGANYMQTMAASVASLCAMSVLIQAMVWLGMPMPSAWKLMLFVGCIGMFGVGVGMLYTPLLVDKLQLEYPSGHAVANILRALTDKRLLKASIAKLGGGTALGGLVAALAERVAVLSSAGLSAATVGAGMVVGSRITVPAIVSGVIGVLISPSLREIGWLGPNDPFRKTGFLIALAMICGAAVVDLSLLAVKAIARIRERARAPAEAEPEWKRVNLPRLIAWVVFWAVAVVVVATQVLDQPAGFVAFGLVLALLFVLINGIAYGITDQNPISSAFVLSVLLMSLLGLKDPLVGLMAASILLISTSVGCDMQQDRSTGWRLGTNRLLQFRYQVMGIFMGAILCVVLAKVFMTAYPVLQVNLFDNPDAKQGQWSSAMTFKFVGAIKDIGNLSGYKVNAMLIGLGIGFVIEVLRKVVRGSAGYQRFVQGSRAGFAVGWTMDAVVLASPYASSFGGFVDLPVSLWYGAGGIIMSVWSTATARGPLVKAEPHAEAEVKGDSPKVEAAKESDEELPSDMSTTSLIGGGLIAGESLYFLIAGILGLLALVG
ncbi:MAG: OPT/YSL family transporter [Myxococcaceae bacterium]|nr:OPT/YSL family transporter [Myxococcaceae bacterium]